MNIAEFASALTAEAVDYREEPFELRAGGMSNWYLDHRKGLQMPLMREAAMLIVARAEGLGIIYDQVAGGGVGGVGLAIMTAWSRGDGVEWVMANLDRNDTNDPENGYGLHGGRVTGKTQLVVDDIGTTGSSLIELIDMVRENDGHVEHAINVSDRSQGRVAEALAKIGVAYSALLELDEGNGRLIPIAA